MFSGPLPGLSHVFLGALHNMCWTIGAYVISSLYMRGLPCQHTVRARSSSHCHTCILPCHLIEEPTPATEKKIMAENTPAPAPPPTTTEISEATGLPTQTPREAVVQGPVQVDVSRSTFCYEMYYLTCVCWLTSLQ